MDDGSRLVLHVKVYEVGGEYVVADQGGWIDGTYLTIADALAAVNTPE